MNLVPKFYKFSNCCILICDRSISRSSPLFGTDCCGLWEFWFNSTGISIATWGCWGGRRERLGIDGSLGNEGTSGTSSSDIVSNENTRFAISFRSWERSSAAEPGRFEGIGGKGGGDEGWIARFLIARELVILLYNTLRIFSPETFVYIKENIQQYQLTSSMVCKLNLCIKNRRMIDILNSWYWDR